MKKRIVTAVFLMAIFLNGTAQPNVAEWTKRFNAYQSLWKKTMIHLTLNQDKFSPGDTVWFKAYFLTEDLKGVDGKQLIELNLVDDKGDPKIHLLFIVRNGSGNNQFAIPATLSPGLYLVTAHSSWMKNFDSNQIFKKAIEVVRENKLVVTDEPHVGAFAEGGNLIQGIPNKLVIRTNRPKVSIQLMNISKREISQTMTDENGIASVTFTPTKGESYFLRMVDDSLKVPILTPQDDGCAIRFVPGIESEPARVLFSSPSTSHLRNEKLTIIMTSRARIYHTVSFIQRKKDSVSLEIPRGDFDGIAHLSLLDEKGNLLASRDFYNTHGTGLQASIDPGKYHFQRREKVRLRISLTDTKGRPVEGEFSLSVRNARLFDSEKEVSFTEGFLVSGMEKPFNINRSDPNSLATLDNYLITVSTAVPWKEILSQNHRKPLYSFTGAVRKIGRAYYANTLEPVRDHTQIMFYLQKDMMRYQTSTTDSGKVWLTMPDVFEPDEFFYVAETRKGNEILNLKIEWENEPFQLPYAPSSRETNAPDPYASFISKIRLIDRSYKFYSSRETITSRHNNYLGNDFEYEVGGADITIDSERYVVYPTMQELIKEVIPSLFHRTRGGRHFVRVSLPEPMMAKTTGDPVYIIDGIATKNTDFFLSLKPSDLLGLKIVKDAKKLALFGLMGKNGIVIVETKAGNIREPLDDPGKLLEGINRAVKFQGPDYSVSNDLRRPDFRSTLHWEPSIKTDANGNAVVEFFCSDDPGRMEIRINGLTASGEPFSANHAIEVVSTGHK